MRSKQKSVDNRRDVYLALVSSIESQLRDAYALRYENGEETQTSIAEKLGIEKSAVSRRLKGHTNMTLKTLADMVWALGQCIDVEIFDPQERSTNRRLVVPALGRIDPALVMNMSGFETDDKFDGMQLNRRPKSASARPPQIQFESVMHEHG